MKIAYICGAYTGIDKEETAENVERAKGYAEKYMRMGYSIICPHTNFFDTMCISEKAILDCCCELVKRCDLIVAIPGYRESKGAMKELSIAANNGIAIHYDITKTIEETQWKG